MFHITDTAETPAPTPTPTFQPVLAVNVKVPIVVDILRWVVIIATVTGVMFVLLGLAGARQAGLGVTLLGVAFGLFVVNSVIRLLASIEAHVRALLNRS